MGKKRKASGRPFGQSDAGEIKESDSKLRIDSYADVADSEDEFHINRDKILLDDTAEQKRRKRWREEDDLLQPSDEEVLRYSSPSASDDDEDDDDVDEDEGETKPPPPKRTHYSSNSDDEEREEEDDEIKDWGTSKRDYYNADTIETEQDALEEEVEARRLQQKQLQGMTEADFGFDENEWMDSGKTGAGQDDQENDGEKEAGHIITEVLPPVEITDDMSVEERLRILRSRHPEFEPLAAEFLSLQSQHQDLALAAAAADTLAKRKAALKSTTNGKHGGETVDSKLSAANIKYQALAAYLGSICMYFALLTSTEKSKDGKTTAMPPGELRDHIVMENLVKCRNLWSKVKDVRIPDSSELATNRNELAVIEESDEQPPITNEQNAVVTSTALPEKKQKKPRKSKTQRAAEIALAEASARRAARIQETEQELAQLSILPKSHKPSKKSVPTAANDSDDSDFGEETHLTPTEAAEKARRKKSLRFYTSQITQKSNRRDAAGNDAGGDADLPYRERFRDRQARLNTEAEKRGQRDRKKDNASADLGGDSGEEDRHVANEVRIGNDEEYYNLIASSSRQRKAEKKALHDAEVAAAKAGGVVHVEQTVGSDGKRAIGYTIEKNKGLAPKRKKDVRNPRVKKRKKYEDKMKKLASVRQVYKGGEGRGGYGGEKTGIKGNLVKSTKL